ncbi:hypothetical protein [Phaffia rhodozyma]|uniref:Uncharacterized protein n=1 Tax=Phaffia rhodozyma TaxID=264483 RepID=A0A0F7SFZ8_PHARH|nr:hypothetical protein [Phaffia rhodozyma]
MSAFVRSTVSAASTTRSVISTSASTPARYVVPACTSGANAPVCRSFTMSSPRLTRASVGHSGIHNSINPMHIVLFNYAPHSGASR